MSTLTTQKLISAIIDHNRKSYSEDPEQRSAAVTTNYTTNPHEARSFVDRKLPTEIFHVSEPCLQ